jgi:branched-chain amino acid transport system substrate-binding protein
MEQLTKRILAIVLIAVIGVAIGFTVWIFVAPYAWSAADCPGLENRTDITEDQIIRIGVLGGMTDIQGKGAYEGAWLAAKEINTRTTNPGIIVNGKQYYIGITTEDTQESYTNLDVTTGNAAAQRIINYKRAQFLLGGFRSESLLAYQEIIMDNKIVFISTGAATDVFTMNVRGFAAGDYPGLPGFPGSNYDRYKYFFRNTPINSTSLGGEILSFVAGLMSQLNTTLNYGHEMSPTHNITSIGILREDLTWTEPLAYAVANYLPAPYHVVQEIKYPITVSSGSFTTYLQQLNSSGVQVLVPIISAQGGEYMMHAYDALHPNYIIVGIDVQGQLESYWTSTNEECKYETMLQTVMRTNRTSKTIAMWDAYVAKWGDSPLYTACGGYDAVYQFEWAINTSQSFNSDTIVSTLETITTANPLEGSGAEVAFISSHDIQEGWPYGLALFCQWQADGTKTIVSSPYSKYPHPINLLPSPPYPAGLGKLYPDTLIGVAPYTLIPWGINPGL